MNKAAVLFDLDGTLLDTLQDLTDSVNAALALHGCEQRSVEQIRSALGNGARELIRLSLPEQGSGRDVDQVLKDYQAHYRNNCQNRTQPYPGILQALRQLAERYPLGIVSNKPDIPTKALCAHYFPGIPAWGEQAGLTRKPAPDMLYAAMKQLGVERCVYVGDSEVDIRTAENMGMPCLSVSWGFRREEELLRFGASHLCRDPQQLHLAVEALISAHF